MSYYNLIFCTRSHPTKTCYRMTTPTKSLEFIHLILVTGIFQLNVDTSIIVKGSDLIQTKQSPHKTSADWGILQRRHLLRAGLTNWRGNKFRLWRKPLLKWEDSVFGWRCLRKDRHNVRKGRPISKLELTELIISTWLLVIRLKFCSLPDLGVSAYTVVIRG